MSFLDFISFEDQSSSELVEVVTVGTLRDGWYTGAEIALFASPFLPLKILRVNGYTWAYCKEDVDREMLPLEILEVHNKENEALFQYKLKNIFQFCKFIRLKPPRETCKTVLSLNTPQTFTTSFCKPFPKPNSPKRTLPRRLFIQQLGKACKEGL